MTAIGIALVVALVVVFVVIAWRGLRGRVADSTGAGPGGYGRTPRPR